MPDYATLYVYQLGDAYQPPRTPGRNREVRARGGFSYIWDGPKTDPLLVAQELVDNGALADCPFPLRPAPEHDDALIAGKGFLRTDVKKT